MHGKKWGLPVKTQENTGNGVSGTRQFSVYSMCPTDATVYRYGHSAVAVFINKFACVVALALGTALASVVSRCKVDQGVTDKCVAYLMMSRWVSRHSNLHT